MEASKKEQFTMNWLNRAVKKRAAHKAAVVVLFALWAGLANGAASPAVPISAKAASASKSNAVWTLTGSMHVPRAIHTATLLHDGRVLVTGGVDENGSITASAELYDPTTRTWRVTGSMAKSRTGHFAFLLPSGKVLVIGGDSRGSPATITTELYDPDTETWDSARTPGPGVGAFAATFLKSGQIFITGGIGTFSVALLYDPVKQTWAQLSADPAYRQDPDVSLLSDGRVLVQGGTTDADEVVIAPGAELFDPTTGAWTRTSSPGTLRTNATNTLLPDGSILGVGGIKYVSQGTQGSVAPLMLQASELYGVDGQRRQAGDLNDPRWHHTATLLPDGRVLVAGGLANAYLTSTETYDPNNATWSPASPLNIARFWHTATLLNDGSVLVAGGYTKLGGSQLATAEIYEAPKGPSVWTVTRFMSAARAYHTATLLPGGKVLVAGGASDVSNPLASAELYDPATAVWSATGAMAGPRAGHVAILLNSGKVLVLGQSDASFGEIYDPASGTWSKASPPGQYRDYFSATLLKSGKVLVAGGSDHQQTTVFKSAEVYDPASDSWTAAGSLTTARYQHDAVLLADGRVLVVGGFIDFGDDFFGPSPIALAEIYDPATNKWTPTGELPFGRAGGTDTLLPDGTVLLAGGGTDPLFQISPNTAIYDSSGTWHATTSMQRARTGHTATLLADGRVFIVAGVGSANFTQGNTTYFGVESLATTEIYNPGGASWTRASSLNVARGYHTSTLLPNGNILVTGGVSVQGRGQFTSYLSSAEIYQATPPIPETAFVVTGVFSDQAGLYQLIQLQEVGDRDGQDHVAGKTFTVTSLSGVAKQFVFPYDLPNPNTAGRTILIKTESFALPDGWFDFVVRDGFVPTDGGTFSAEGPGGWTATFPALPADGHTMLQIYFGVTPQPFALVQGFTGPAFHISIGTDPAIEYYNPNLDHYFITASQPDVDALDSARIPGWKRTGFTFPVWISRYFDPQRPAGQNPPPGLVDVCRIYIPPQDGDSHFFSASAVECALAQAQHPEFVQETSSAFLTTLPNTATGSCPAGQTPVYRVWNARADSNHRYTTSLDIRNAMLAKGYVPEGYGPDGVALCAGGGS